MSSSITAFVSCTTYSAKQIEQEEEEEEEETLFVNGMHNNIA